MKKDQKEETNTTRGERKEKKAQIKIDAKRKGRCN